MKKYFLLFSVDAGIRKKYHYCNLAKDRLVSSKKVEIVIAFLVKYVATIVMG